MTDPSGITIEFVNVCYQVDSARPILASLNLAIRAGEIMMLLGRSGSGKTTSLKLINRLLVPTEGEVLVEGIATNQWDPIKLRRHIGYAIQEVGLFPHYTVQQNVALVPRLEHWEQPRIEARVNDVLRLVGLMPEQFARRYPDELSGGQRQRAGLARALAADPPILLMDEPFGALDPITRAELQNEFRELQQRLHKTVVFVTHDVGEALRLGTRVALMDSGTLRGIYTPQEFMASADDHVRSYVEAFRAGQQLLDPER